MRDDDTESVLKTHEFVVQRIRATCAILQIVERPTDAVLLCRLMLIVTGDDAFTQNVSAFAAGLHCICLADLHVGLSFYRSYGDALKFIEASLPYPGAIARARHQWATYNGHLCDPPPEELAKATD